MMSWEKGRYEGETLTAPSPWIPFPLLKSFAIESNINGSKNSAFIIFLPCIETFDDFFTSKCNNGLCPNNIQSFSQSHRNLLYLLPIPAVHSNLPPSSSAFLVSSCMGIACFWRAAAAYTCYWAIPATVCSKPLINEYQYLPHMAVKPINSST